MKASGGNRTRIPTRQARLLSDGPSYKGQQICRLQVIGEPALLSTVVTTGLIAYVYALDNNLIAGFSARFGSTFDEYRFIRTIVTIRPVSAAPGITKFWFDEQSSATPTANESFERTQKVLTNTNANSKSVTTMTWSPRDLKDLDFTAIGTQSNAVWFKVYTDTADYASPNTVTPLWIIEPLFTIEFRGLKST